MSDSTPSTPWLERAAALAPLIRRCADESERERRLAPDLVEAFHDAELFRLQIPVRFGGAGLDPVEALPVFEEVAAADGSAGWNLAIGAGGGAFAAMLDDADALEEIVGAPRALIAGSVNPTALRLEPEADGYRLSGRLRYASGVSQSTWLMAGGIVFDPGNPRPRMTRDGAPVIVGTFFPTREARVLDTWRPNGLAGTGSHDVEVSDVHVPAARCFEFFSTKPRAFDPLASLPLFSRLGAAIAGVGIGIARRAIDELVALAREKVPIAGASHLRDRAGVQIDVARARGLVDCARAHVTDTAREVFARVKSGAVPSIDDQVRLRLAYVTAADHFARAADLVRNAAGMNAIELGSPLERCWRDAHAVTQHIAISPAHLERLGRITLGLDPGPGPI
jgi:alkylation response protein AidB-like acyl-CoA dehydrogenase